MDKKFTVEDIKRTKPATKTESWIGKFLFNWFTLRFAVFIANYTKLTPRMLSIIGFSSALIAAYFFLKGYVIIGAILFFIRYLFDQIDGDVARLKKDPSRWGVYLDNWTGHLAFGINAFALTFGQFIQTKEVIWLIIGSFLLFFIPLHSWESNRVANIIGKGFKDIIVGKKEEKESKSIIERAKIFLLKHGLLEPFNTEDMILLMLVIAPIICTFTGFLKGTIIVLIIISILKTAFWFIYYSRILVLLDKKDKPDYLLRGDSKNESADLGSRKGG